MIERIIASGDASPIPPSEETQQSRSVQEQATATRLPLVMGEILIEADADWGWIQYTGTAAQLAEEGLIPTDFEWPKATREVHWEADGFSYWLRRRRPEGHKGPMRSWLELDNWWVRVDVTGHGHSWRVRRNLERKAEALRAEYHRHTTAGSRE